MDLSPIVTPHAPASSTDDPLSLERSVGELVAQVAATIATGLREVQNGRLSGSTKARGGDLVAGLFALRQIMVGDWPFDDIAKKYGVEALREQYGSAVNPATIEELITAVMSILGRVVRAVPGVTRASNKSSVGFCNALAARARFKKEHPSWPALPVSHAELDSLWRDLDQRRWSREDAGLQVFLTFALSQRYHHWDPQHPSFRDFGRSVLAAERAPDTIRKNEELKKEFPRAPIVKLFVVTDGTPIYPRIVFLHWLSPRMIASGKAEGAFSRARKAGASVEEAREAGRRAYRESLST